MIYNFLFPTKPNATKVSLLLLAVRIIFGILLMNHGIQKWSSFQELSATFPDPLGIGSPISLGLAIFAELVCSMAFIIGFLYRLAMIPMIFTMIIAFFVVHTNDVFAVKELAFVYLVVFTIIYIVGPGKFSIDHIIGNELLRRKSTSYKKQ
ncbi:DoxX family protein [uncultured Bacteroides sp.]|uniref:DoxX family protein n=1 Tax=uncultured Bacteroides sp. TaxID=162156 RepID=UPI0025DDF98E|nr:DoxX family protein [uncultured Bacteroides sp.]